MNNLDNNVKEIYQKTQPVPGDRTVAPVGLSQKVVSTSVVGSLVKTTVEKIRSFVQDAILWVGGWEYTDLQTLYTKYKTSLANVQTLETAQQEQLLSGLAEQFTEDFIKTRNKEFDADQFITALSQGQEEGGIDIFGAMSVKKEALQLKWFKAVFQYMQKHEALSVLQDWGFSLQGDMRESVLTYVAKQYIQGKQFEQAHEIMATLSTPSCEECNFLLKEYSRNFVQETSQSSSESLFFDKIKQEVPLAEEVSLWLARLTEQGKLHDVANKETGTPHFSVRFSGRLKAEVLFGIDLRSWGPEAIRVLLQYITPEDRAIFTLVNDWTDFIYQSPTPKDIKKKHAQLCEKLSKLSEDARNEVLGKAKIVTHEALKKRILDSFMKNGSKQVDLKDYYSTFLMKLKDFAILDDDCLEDLNLFLGQMPVDVLLTVAQQTQRLGVSDTKSDFQIVQGLVNLIAGRTQDSFTEEFLWGRICGILVAKYVHATPVEQAQIEVALLALPQKHVVKAFSHSASAWSRVAHDEEYSTHLVDVKSAFERLKKVLDKGVVAPEFAESREELQQAYYRLSIAPLAVLTHCLKSPEALTKPEAIERIKKQMALLPKGSITPEKVHVLFASLLPFMDGKQVASYPVLIELFEDLYTRLTQDSIKEMGTLINDGLYVQQVRMPDSQGYQPREDDVFLAENPEQKAALQQALSIYTEVGVPRNPPKVEGINQLFADLETEYPDVSLGEEKIQKLAAVIAERAGTVDIVSLFYALLTDPGKWSADDKDVLVLLLKSLDEYIQEHPEQTELVGIREQGILGLLQRVSQESQEDYMRLVEDLYVYYATRTASGQPKSLAEQQVVASHENLFKAELTEVRATFQTLKEKRVAKNLLKNLMESMKKGRKTGTNVSSDEIDSTREAQRNTSQEIDELKKVLAKYKDGGEEKQRIFALMKMEKDVFAALCKKISEKGEWRIKHLEEALAPWVSQVHVIRRSLKRTLGKAADKDVEIVAMMSLKAIITLVCQERNLTEEQVEQLRSVFVDTLSKKGIRIGVGSFVEEGISSRASEVALSMTGISQMSDVEALIKKMSYVYDHEIGAFSPAILDAFVDKLANILSEDSGNQEKLEMWLAKRSLSARVRYLLRAAIVVSQVREGRQGEEVLQLLQPGIVERLRRGYRNKLRPQRVKHEKVSVPKSQLKEEQLALLARLLPQSAARDVVSDKITSQQELDRAVQSQMDDTQADFLREFEPSDEVSDMVSDSLLEKEIADPLLDDTTDESILAVRSVSESTDLEEEEEGEEY